MVDGVGFGRDSSLLVRLCLCLPTQEKSPAVFAVGGEVSATPDNPPLSFSPLKVERSSCAIINGCKIVLDPLASRGSNGRLGEGSTS